VPTAFARRLCWPPRAARSRTTYSILDDDDVPLPPSTGPSTSTPHAPVPTQVEEEREEAEQQGEAADEAAAAAAPSLSRRCLSSAHRCSAAHGVV